jgi:DHA2 family methylenomycin A resistance protein-like MFS transporter
VAALVAGFAIGAVLAGELFLVTLQLQELRGFGPILAGAAFLPLTVPMVVNPPLAGRLVARVGPRGPVLGGLLLVTAGAATLAILPADTAFVPFGCALAALGLGFSFTLPSLTAAAVIAAPAEATGTAGGIFSVGRQIGATVGVAVAAAAIGGDLGRLGRGQALLAIAAVAAALAWVALSGRRASERVSADVPVTARRSSA